MDAASLQQSGAGPDGEIPVVVVGGGPVGLFLALCLHRRGIGCRVLEREAAVGAYSRAIGIHPPALERLDSVGLGPPLVTRGVPVRRGEAWAGRRRLGVLDFAGCPGPFPFVLSMPQSDTERLLEATLAARAPGTLIRGVTVEEVRVLEDRREGAAVRVQGRRSDGTVVRLAARLVVGCDGAHSAVRRAAGLAWEGGPYADTFAMGDFEDDTGFGPVARVFLGPEGLVESFPLPGGMRRWVLRTRPRDPPPEAETFRRKVHARTGYRPAETPPRMLRPFGVQRFAANPVVHGPVVLAGDAAHVVSPIGGQGLNLGWMDAFDLAEALGTTLRGLGDGSGAAPGEAALRRALEDYGGAVRRRAARAARRAELNMALGGRTGHPRARELLVRGLLASPASRVLARLFTMRWL